MNRTAPLLVAILVGLAGAAAAGSELPAFEATSLEGKRVGSAQLVGRPAVLIVTPSQAAATDTRRWAQALASHFEEKSVRMRDVLAIDLPFFISETDALAKARQRIPARYHSRTWLLAEPSLERALAIPTDSASAYVFVLDSHGSTVSRVEGSPTREKVDEVVSAVRDLKR